MRFLRFLRIARHVYRQAYLRKKRGEREEGGKRKGLLFGGPPFLLEPPVKTEASQLACHRLPGLAASEGRRNLFRHP